MLPLAHTPTVGNGSVVENSAGPAGSITRSPLDAGVPGYFKITAIQGGRLFLHDGTTSVSDGSFVRFADGEEGLVFSPDRQLDRSRIVQRRGIDKRH